MSIPESCNAIEVIAEVRWRMSNKVPRIEVVTPGIIIYSHMHRRLRGLRRLSRYRRRCYRWLGRGCRGKNWIEGRCRSWLWCGNDSWYRRRYLCRLATCDDLMSRCRLNGWRGYSGLTLWIDDAIHPSAESDEHKRCDNRQAANATLPIFRQSLPLLPDSERSLR
jgi:hypothetical protein